MSYESYWALLGRFSLVIYLEHSQESFLWNFNLADALHALLALLLLFEQLALARDVAAVTFGQDVFAQGLDRLAGDDARADGRLDRHLEQLPWNELAHLFDQRAPARVGGVFMHDQRERVNRIARDQHVQLYQVGFAVTRQMIIERGVTARDRLQPVEEVEHYLVERKVVCQQHARRRDVIEALLDAALLFEQREYVPEELVVGHDHRLDDRLLDAVDVTRRRHLRGVVDAMTLPADVGHAVTHARRGRDQVDVELAFETLLHDFHVQQAQEAAAEPEPQRRRDLRLEEERRVVQPQLFERVAQLFILIRLDRVDPGEDHRLDLLKSGERLGRRPRGFGDCVADAHVGHGLDVGHDEADFAHAQSFDLARLRRQHAKVFDLVIAPLGHQADLRPLAQFAVDHANHDDHAAISVEP